MQKRISVRDLVEFILRSGSIAGAFTGRDRLEEGARIHRKLQKAEGYKAEVYLLATQTCGGVDFTVEGRCDGLITSEDGVTIDEIKSTLTPLEQIGEDFSPVHWAQAMCYGHIYCVLNNIANIDIRLTYYEMETGGIKRFTRSLSSGELSVFFTGLLEKYAVWTRFEAAWGETAAESMRALEFPYESYRESQRKFAAAVYKTIAGEGMLLAMAPTGVGKTISTLFPSIKAMGEGRGRKTFYLTARTITRQAAQDALDKMRQRGLRVKSVVITAKSKICAMVKDEAPTGGGGFAVASRETVGGVFASAAAPRAAGTAGGGDAVPACRECRFADGHFDRVNDAIYDVICNCDGITAETVVEYARRHRVCPFELSLDLTLWSDVIICDYNYLFDPQVYLRRFFADGGDYIFLVDEAHNLADRAREMFSATLRKRELLDAKKLIGGIHASGDGTPPAAPDEPPLGLPGQTPLTMPLAAADTPQLIAPDNPRGRPRKRKKAAAPCSKELAAINKLLVEKRKECADSGFITEREPPGELLEALEAFAYAFTDWLGGSQGQTGRGGAQPDQQLLEAYFSVLSFIKIAELFDERYVTLYETGPAGELTVRLFCADPSYLLSQRFSRGRAAVLFSATLTPSGYFREVLGGGENSKYLAVPSPFPPNNLLVLIADDISTRYVNREHSYERIADMIERAAAGRRGNYIAYFPSYSYLAAVYAIFTEKYPEIKTARQASRMDEEERARFLELFDETNETMVAFCVLGGVFSEGVDLPGDMLIGTVIIGVGLPQINTELDIVRNHYNATGDGFDFAYRLPGMNKVLQAAGRVIRSGEDRGIVLLIDDRFAARQYSGLFPQHWRNRKTVRGAEELSAALKEFWQEQSR